MMQMWRIYFIFLNMINMWPIVFALIKLFEVTSRDAKK